jgi:serine/threonine protein phosphatase PrpC
MEIHFDSLIGHRPQNEDKHDINLNINNNNNNMNNVNFLGVYDGHGGRLVSKFLHENLSAYFMDKNIKYPLSRSYINRVFNHIQKSLQVKHRDYSLYSGSTCLALIHFKKDNADYLNIMNLGDCRAVLCRDNIGISLTKDHKPHWPEEKIRIQNLGGKITFDGEDWRIKDLSVSRAFGDVKAQPFVTHLPDIYRYRVDPTRDKFVILACDGLWDVIDNQEAVNFILLNCYNNDLQTKHNQISNIAKKLAEYAIKKGSMDNITIIVAFFV